MDVAAPVAKSKYCMSMAGRFSGAVGFFLGLTLVLSYFFCRNMQVQMIDTDLGTATGEILAQFQAFQQTSALRKAVNSEADAEKRAADDDDSNNDNNNASDESTSESDASADSGAPAFVNLMGSDSETTPTLDDALFVRLINPDGSTAAEAPTNRQFPAVETAMERLQARRTAMNFDFAGGGTLPVVRVETSQLGRYRMQVARSWRKTQGWLLLLRDWLIAIAAGSALLAGAAGFGVALRSTRPIEIAPRKKTGVALPQVVEPQAVNQAQEAQQEIEAPVSRRTLVEKPLVRREQAPQEPVRQPQELPAERVLRNQTTGEEEEEQQIIVRRPPDN